MVWAFGKTTGAFEQAIAIVTDPSPNVTSKPQAQWLTPFERSCRDVLDLILYLAGYLDVVLSDEYVHL